MGHYLDLAKEAIEDIEKTKSFKPTKPSSRSELAAMSLKNFPVAQLNI